MPRYLQSVLQFLIVEAGFEKPPSLVSTTKKDGDKPSWTNHHKYPLIQPWDAITWCFTVLPRGGDKDASAGHNNLM